MTIGVSDPFSRAQGVFDDRGGCPGNKQHHRSL